MIKLTFSFVFIFISFITGSINAMELKVLTHNLAMKSNDALFRSMSSHLKEMNLFPDIIFVQEVVGETGGMLKKHFNMNAHYSKRPWDNEAVGVLTRYPISYSNSLTLNSRAENGFTRTAAMIEFNHPQIGLIRAVAIHFAYRLEQDHIRFQQMREVKSWIEQRDHFIPAKLNFIGGDFNAPPNEHLFNHLRDFIDPNSKTITHFPTKRRIDYIFFKNANNYKKKNNLLKKVHWKEIFPFPQGTIEGNELSDHKSVLFLLNNL